VALLDLDWRFLLPRRADTPRRMLLLGASPATVDEVERAGIASELLVHPGESADLVVCLAAAGISPAAAAAHLAPGGVLYHERSFPRTSLPGKLSALGKYWVHPRFTGPRSYVPLDVDGALAWYLSTVGAPRTAVAESARRAVARLRPTRFARLAPRIALVAVDRRADGPDPKIFAGAQTPPAVGDEGLRPLLLAHGGALSRAVLLPFARDSARPVAVVKLHRTNVSVETTEYESTTLLDVRGRLSPKLEATVPEPLGFTEVAGRLAAVESFLDGEWLLSRWARRRSQPELVEDLERVTQWLCAFHTETTIERRQWSPADAERRIGRPVAAYTESFGVTPAEQALFAQVNGLAQAAIGTSLPVVWQHGDLSSLNVILAPDRVGVIDWRNAGTGLPLDDLLYFVTRWLYRARGAEDESPAERAVAASAFDELFFAVDTKDVAVLAARRSLLDYVHALELDPGLVTVIFVHAWIARAVWRHTQQTRPGARPRDARGENRYVTLVEHVAEQRARLAQGFPWTD
jgi:hypothetical protein